LIYGPGGGREQKKPKQKKGKKKTPGPCAGEKGVDGFGFLWGFDDVDGWEGPHLFDQKSSVFRAHGEGGGGKKTPGLDGLVGNGGKKQGQKKTEKKKKKP